MTYPESEIRRVLKEMRFMSVSDDELIKAMKPCSDSDRERVRMELWKDAYIATIGHGDCANVADTSIDDFDKQFPNS